MPLLKIYHCHGDIWWSWVLLGDLRWSWVISLILGDLGWSGWSWRSWFGALGELKVVRSSLKIDAQLILDEFPGWWNSSSIKYLVIGNLGDIGDLGWPVMLGDLGNLWFSWVILSGLGWSWVILGFSSGFLNWNIVCLGWGWVCGLGFRANFIQFKLRVLDGLEFKGETRISAMTV